MIGIMVVTGGAIAFIGDKLGTKIGKKRLSIFNLRPRHTSMIITVITGSLITALTMGTLAVVSKDVRTALFGMEELNAAMESTKIELGAVTDELSKTQEEYRQAEDNSELTSQNENLSNKNSELQADNKKLAEFNVTLTSEKEKLTKDNETLEEHAKNLREGLIAMREGDIIFKAGEILSSGVIKANQSSEKIAEDINHLADAASRSISERFGETVDSSVWIYQPELNRAIETISNSQQDMILRISAAGNLVRGEPIRTSLSLYKNDHRFGRRD